MSSASKLKEVLKARMYSGHLWVPTVRNTCVPDTVLQHRGEGLEASPIRSEENKAKAKDYFIRTFYHQGIIPHALKLGPHSDKLKIVHQEIEMMLDSELCVQVNEEKTGQLVGCSFNCLWPVDNNYDAFEVHPRDWLNTAAEIAEESAVADPNLKNDESRNFYMLTIWRDYQYQYIYHYLQEHAKKQGKKHTIYGGMLFINPEYRGKMFNYHMYHNITSNIPQDAMFGGQGLFPIKNGTWGNMFVTSFVPWSELTLRWFGNDRPLVFGHLTDNKVPGITFGVTKH